MKPTGTGANRAGQHLLKVPLFGLKLGPRIRLTFFAVAVPFQIVSKTSLTNLHCACPFAVLRHANAITDSKQEREVRNIIGLMTSNSSGYLLHGYLYWHAASSHIGSHSIEQCLQCPFRIHMPALPHAPALEHQPVTQSRCSR